MKQLLAERVKIILAGLAIASATAIITASCTSMRKDCQGRKHKKLPNGIYITVFHGISR